MAHKQTYLDLSDLTCISSRWRLQNSVKLLINAELFYPAMLSAVESAKEVIYLEMYLIKSGEITTRFIDAFLAAGRRNVQVYLLFDGFGGHEFSEADRTRLKADNIYLSFYNPLSLVQLRRNLFRDHRKILIVDHKQAFIGSAGIADDLLPIADQQSGWRETMLEIRGECIRDWVTLFEEAWRINSHVPLPRLVFPDIDVTRPQTGRVVCAMGRSRQGIKRSLINRIRVAKQRVWISTAYFIPSFKVRRALIRAAKRGVDVRLLLPGEKTDHPSVRQAGRRFYAKLLRAGINIYEYQPRFLHEKVLLCDEWVSIGSSNIDRWNFRWNLEANQEVDDTLFAAEVTSMFERDFEESKIIDFESWKQRSVYSRIQEWFWGKVDQILDRWLK